MPWRRIAAATAMTFVLTSAGCSHEIQSPELTLKDAVPDLVCTEQLTIDVTITGTGLRPMPSKTLPPPPELVFPAISLGRPLDLGGAAADGPVAIPDDPAAPAASYVHWDSELQMRFRIDPALAVV